MAILMEKIILSGFSDEIAPGFDQQLAAVKEFGLGYIELRAADGINVSDFTPEKLREVKGKLAEAGIKVSSIGSPIGKINITDDFQGHMEKFKRTLEIQKELGAPFLRMFSFYLPEGKSPADCKEEVFSRVGALAEEAGRWDAVLLHENEKEIYGDTAPRCLELMKAFYGPHFKGIFDFSNFVEVGQDTLEAYQTLKPYIAYIHVKDCLAEEKRVVPAGKGDGHVKEILSDLIAGGFAGFLSLEPHLTDFMGLAALEQHAQKREETDGKAAWKTALDALRGILQEIPAAR